MRTGVPMSKVTIKSLPHEIFQAVQDAKTKAERVSLLKNYSSFATKTILQLNFDDRIKLDLPEGTPPYRDDEAPAGMARAPINKQITILPKLTPNNKMPRLKKEGLFIRCLEGINGNDAKTIVAAKDGQLTKMYSKLTKSLIKEVFPNIVAK